MFIKLFAKYKGFLILFSVIFLISSAKLAHPDTFEKLERGHFVVYHNDRSFANKLSWKAEYHYKRIINHFGVKKFRPWEGKDKCPIYLYNTKDQYLKATGAPEWSAGLAQYGNFRFSSYKNAPNLLVDTLPHEMTHMLFYLFMEKKPIPLWLNEGMAQFEEEDRSAIYRRKKSIKQHVRKGTYLKLSELFKMSYLSKNMADEEVALFYDEAASLIDHLITDNIRTNYGRFLSALKKGETIEAALKKSYQWKYKNGTSDLEKRWLEFARKKY